MKELLKSLPYNIKKHIKDFSYGIDDIGHSGAKILCFENDMVLKIELSSETSNTEHTMIKWLQNKLPVPKLIESCSADGYNYLLMSKLEGRMSCDEYYLKKPEELVRLLAEGLKMLWKVDISDCPYINVAENKLKSARLKIEEKLIDIEDFEPETFSENGFKDIEELYKFLEDNKPNQELLFSHGDYCLPNIFFNNIKNIVSDHSVSGFIDLGNCGIADKWQDIALCVRSLAYNLGTDAYTDLLFEELEIEKNIDKIRYYILLEKLF